MKDKNLFIDKSSDKDFNRKNYLKLLKKVQAGDEIIVKSIDILGRNYNEILEQWHYLTKEKQANIKVLDFPLLNTKKSIDNITGKLISDLVLQILSYVAQFEIEEIKKRQDEGIKESKRRGVLLVQLILPLQG